MRTPAPFEVSEKSRRFVRAVPERAAEVARGTPTAPATRRAGAAARLRSGEHPLEAEFHDLLRLAHHVGKRLVVEKHRENAEALRGCDEIALGKRRGSSQLENVPGSVIRFQVPEPHRPTPDTAGPETRPAGPQRRKRLVQERVAIHPELRILQRVPEQRAPPGDLGRRFRHRRDRGGHPARPRRTAASRSDSTVAKSGTRATRPRGRASATRQSAHSGSCPSAAQPAGPTRVLLTTRPPGRQDDSRQPGGRRPSGRERPRAAAAHSAGRGAEGKPADRGQLVGGRELKPHGAERRTRRDAGTRRATGRSSSEFNR